MRSKSFPDESGGTSNSVAPDERCLNVVDEAFRSILLQLIKFGGNY